MASKTKKRSRKPSTDALFDQAQGQLEKGNYKQALKDAKVCYRQAATDKHRQLLEFASIARAQDLQRQGNRSACQGIIENLLELGVIEPAVQTALPGLLLWLGMLDRLPDDQMAPAGQERGQWDDKIADQAVVDPDRAPRSHPGIVAEAQRVRQALDALSAGGHTSDDLHLKDIPRHSPLADWRLFLRGLSAYYEADLDRMRDNWSRLNPDRVAVRIARRLRAIADETLNDLSDATVTSAIGKLEQSVGARPLYNRLRMFCRQLNSGQLRKALPSLRGICSDLHQLDPALEQRLVSAVQHQLVIDGRVAEMDELAKLIDPLPLDPQWNRSRALVRERSKDASPDAPLPFWRRYIRDLAESQDLQPERRALAQALVWLHLARAYGDEADAMRHCPCGAAHDEEVEEALEEAEECLEHCVKLAPDHAPAYRMWADLHEAARQPDKVNNAYRRLLEHVPDDINALLHLAEHHLIEDEPLQALPYAAQARRAKPLDQEVAILLQFTHMAAARQYALQDEFDRGRAQFQAADELLPARRMDYDVLGRKAVLEIKAGDAVAARQLVEHAQEALAEPTPLWLMMMIEAARYALPQKEVWLYEKRWTDALKRRCRSSTAAEMCQLVYAHQQLRGAKCHLNSNHVQQLVAYVKRCSRVKWNVEDLRAVCALLTQLEEVEVLRKFARKGLKKFRHVAYFHMLDGELEMHRGPMRCNHVKARTSFRKALELAKNSGDPRDQEVEESARVSLTLLDEMAQRPLGDFWENFDNGNESEGENAGDFASAIPPHGMTGEGLRAAFEAMCQELGLDPDEVLADAAKSQGGPGNPFGSRRGR